MANKRTRKKKVAELIPLDAAKDHKPIVLEGVERKAEIMPYWKCHFFRFTWEEQFCPFCQTALSDYNAGNRIAGSGVWNMDLQLNKWICLNCGLFDHHNFIEQDSRQVCLFVRRGMGFRITKPLYSDFFQKAMDNGDKQFIPQADLADQRQLENLTEETIALWKDYGFRERWHKEYWKQLIVDDLEHKHTTGKDRKKAVFISCMMEWTEFAIFADWLGDNNYFYNEQELREQLAQ